MSKFKNLAVAIASLVIFTNITNAQALKENYSVNYEEPLSVKYLSSDNEYLTFQVTFQSAIPGKAFFTIADKNEGVFYSSNFTPEYKVQNIKIEKRDGQVISFKLVLGKKTYSKSFSVNTSLVETTTVSESDLTRL